MSAPRFLLVVSRAPVAPELSVSAVATAATRLCRWVAALRRWQLLHAVAADPSPVPSAVTGCLLVAATDMAAARRLAATCPPDAYADISVLSLRTADRYG